MKKKHNYIIVLILIIAFSGSVSAQKVLTIEECRTQAIDFNKQLKKANFQKQEAEAQQKAARTAYLPAIGADINLMQLIDMEGISTSGNFLPTAESAEAAERGEFTGLSDVWMPGMSLELGNMSVIYGGLTLSQPIYAGGKIVAANNMADAGLEMAGMAYNLKYSEIIELTDKAFWNVAMVTANIKLAEKYIEMLVETEDMMIAMYEVGLQPASEKLKVSVQKNEAELRLMMAKNGLRIAKMNLNQVLGFDLKTVINISYDSVSNIRLIDLTNGTTMAEANRNELKLLEKKVELATLDRKMIAGDYLPQLGVGIQYTSAYAKDYREKIQFSPIVAAQLTIPIFQWGQGQKKKKAAYYKIKQNEMELSRSTDLVNLEVNNTEVRVEEAYEAIIIARKNIGAAEESLDETKSSFEVGLNSTTDLLNAQAQWLNAKVQEIQAVARYKVLETTWKRVTGRLVPGE